MWQRSSTTCCQLAISCRAAWLRSYATEITASVGALGAVAVFFTLAVTGLSSQDAQMVRGAYVAMGLTARFVIAPLVFAALLTGLIQSLGTQWGLFRHYWILAKLLPTVITTVVLLLQMEAINHISTRRGGDDIVQCRSPRAKEVNPDPR